MADQRKKYQFKLSSKYIFIGIILLCFVLFFVASRFPERTQFLRNIVSNFVSPMQNGINRIGKSIYDRATNISDINSLIEQNTQLKAELDELKYEYDMLRRDNDELEAFRSLYELDQKYVQYPKVAARIISRDQNSLYATFTVDKGEKEGIKEGMNVLAGNGLCGIVYEVYEHSSKIRSIIDDTAALSGMSLKSSDTCIVSGNLASLLKDGYIDISMISLNSEIEENAAIVTSHVSDKYHQGILVGYAVNIGLDSSQMAKKANLIPAVDFERLETVLIITQMKE
ncbi:MAG: rod shape-determining protein MreC [Lachnospiraceae bacterium]|nr:rod shape-determining protein MreC [Lachnospiraceae bacterium]